MIRRWVVLGMVTSAILAGCITHSTGAIEGESIVMSPTGVSLDIAAGETINKTFKIINDGTVAYDFKVYASPYSVKNSRYDADFDTRQPNADVYEWVTFTEKRYHLEPGQHIDVPYMISVPTDAAPGGHYSVIFAETQSSGGNGSNVVANKRVGVILYAAVSGDYIRAGRETGVSIPPVKIGGVPSATITLENTGNTHFTGKETIRVKNIFGEKVYERTVDHIMLPKTTRDVPLVWENGATLGWYKVETQSIILDKTVSHSGWVLVSPLWFVVVVVLVLFGIIYMLYRRFRR